MKCFSSKTEIKEHLTQLTKELVRFPSHAGEPLKIFELAQFIKDYFSADRLNIRQHIYNGVPSIFITNKDTKHPHILLSGHIDIVDSPASYTAEVEGDKLRGSGTMDMKGGVACMMAVMKYLAHQEDSPSVGLVLTGDEETGGDSIVQMMKDESYMADFCVINEGRSAYDIVLREKGIFAVKVSIKGDDTHSAYPWKSTNAIEILMEAFLKIKSEFPEVKNDWLPSASVTAIESGQMMNVIPGSGKVIFSFRLTDDVNWTRETLMARLETLLPEAEFKILVHGDVFVMDPENEYVTLLQQVASDVLGKKVEFGQNHGASEARFMPGLGIPTAVLGPIGDSHHSEDEWVSIQSLVDHFEALRQFVLKEQAVCTTQREQLEMGE
jgi:succinyl-diaminopimelate desuccinylase